MSRLRGHVGPSESLQVANKENPGKGFTPTAASAAHRKPLQPCGNVAGSRASMGGTKHEEQMEGEDIAEEMPKLEFEALCFSCEDEEFWKQELQTCCANLRDLNGQWSMRMKQLSRLRFLAKEKHSGIGKPQLTVLLSPRIREVLTVQLSDRRSVLLREVCVTLGSFARLGDAGMPIFCDLLPALFRNLIITTKAIVESSHKCVLTWIRHPAVQSIAYLPQLLEGLENAHPMLRARCAEYIAEMLEKENAAHVLRDEADKLESAVLKSLTDGDGDVRAIARRAYLVYCSYWPDRGQRIWSRLEYGTQRQLEADRKERRKGEKRDLDTANRASQDAPRERQLPTLTLPPPVTIALPTPVRSTVGRVAAQAPPAAAAVGSPLKRARTADHTPAHAPTAATALTTTAPPALNLKRSLSLAANTAKMLSLAKTTLQPRPPNA